MSATTTYRKRTLIAYEVDESSDELVAKILGVFHSGQDWENTLRAIRPIPRRADRVSVCMAKCAAARPAATVGIQRPQQQLSVPRFPWYF